MARDIARLGLAIGGAYIGAQFGMPGLGWAAGSLVGNALFPVELPDQHGYGPRLDDLKVQTSSYGRMVPWVRGTVRIAGNVIWAAPLREVATTTTEEVGGKGGPSQTVSQTTYTYLADFSLALCEGEIDGIRRMWINGELVYDIGEDATAATIISSSSRWSNLTIYTGSETQSPDPVMESYEGTGNVPAYLGTAHLVFEGLDVTQWRTIPQIEVEVVCNGSRAPKNVFHDVSEAATADQYTFFDADRMQVWATFDGAGAPKILVLDLNTSAITEITPPASSLAAANDFTGTGPHGFLDSSNGLFWANLKDAGAANYLVAFDLDTHEVRINWHGTTTNIQSVLHVYGDRMVLLNSTVRMHSWSLAGLGSQITASGMGQDWDKTIDRSIYADDPHTFWWISGGTAVVQMTTSGTSTWSIPSSRITSIREAISWTRDTIYFLATNSGTIYLMSFDMAAGTFDTLASGSQFDDVNDLRFSEDLDRIIAQWWNEPSDTGGYLIIDPDDGSIETDYNLTVPSGYAPAAFSSKQFVYAHDGVCFTKAHLAIQEFRFSSLSDSSPTLASVVTDVCAEVGLDASDIVVSALTSQTVNGIAITSTSTARQVLEPLMFCYAFDAVESDGKIKFVLRGEPSVADIADEDLGMSRGEQTPKVEITRTSELELPVETRLLYMDLDADYQPGGQYERRLTGRAIDIAEMNVPIVLSGDEAKRIVTRALYARWAARTSLRFQIGPEFSYLEPTDVVTVTHGSQEYTVYLRDVRDDGLVLKCDGVTDDAAVYSQSADGVSLPAPVANVAGLVGTTLVPLDIRTLRAADDYVGVYLAAAGAADGWRGCEVWKSLDGVNYTRTGVTITAATPIGVATTALPDFDGGHIVDEHSRVTVTLNDGSGTLASVDYDDFLLGESACVIGDEILLRRNATLSSGTTYTLAGFLRGRAATDDVMGSHVAGERFVQLSPATLARLPLSVAEIGRTIYLKAVSFGRTLAQTSPVIFTFENVSKRPLAPIHLEGGRNGDTKVWTFRWTRRSRLAEGWKANTEAPIGEGSLAFEVDVFSSGTFATLKRTISVTDAETCEYSYDDQFTDFGSWPTTMYVRVYQLSTEYGRGDYAEGTLS
jgi:hypothetical protein